LVAAQETRGKTGAALSVRFRASHPDGASSSSTAETSLAMIFQRAGFEIVDDRSSRPPQFEIVGEVIAERGAKLGPLYPCRAMLNVKVRQVSSGNIIAFDRQTGESLDTRRQLRSTPPWRTQPGRSPRGSCRH